METSVPPAIVNEIKSAFRVEIKDFSSAGGGCINSGGKLTTTTGTFFLKWNDGGRFPGMFSAEAKGLDLLRSTATLHVPEVIGEGVGGRYQFLLLEYINEGHRAKDYWQELGAGLAAMHRNSSGQFGLDHDNYIGSLPQRNRFSASWAEFFVRERLAVQLQMAIDGGRIERQIASKFSTVFQRLHEWVPAEPPALLHGDLWSGNLLTSFAGKPCLIDPAVYFGHREMDLAMMRLFGGFHVDCFHAYAETFPLTPGFEDRADLYNLYPLLVHVNLFGGGYAAQVASIINRFV